MKLKYAIILTLAMAFGLYGIAMAEGDKPLEVELKVGGAINNVDDAESRVTEYGGKLNDSPSWVLGGKASYFNEKVLFNLDADYRDGDDQAYSGYLDASRVLQLKTDYLEFFHRLDHDNLSNLLASTNTNGQGAALYHTDFNIGDHYGISRKEWKNEAVFKAPMLPGLTISFNHRLEEREGLDQARTMSKCAGCHVVGMSKNIDETTNEYAPSVNFKTGAFSMNYKFMYRSFDAGGDVPMASYMQAARQENTDCAGNPTLFPDYDPFLQYDSQDGSLPFSRTPDSEKFSHVLKGRADLNSCNVLGLGLVYSKSINNDTDDGLRVLQGNHSEELEVDYFALNGNWHWKINKQMAFGLKAKYQEMDGDEIFIDVNERYAQSYPAGTFYGNPAGNPVGLNTTYAEWMGFSTFDYVRESAYDENEFIVVGNFDWKLRKDLKLKFAYELEYTDRENAEAHSVTPDTTSHTFDVGARWKVQKGLKVSLDYAFNYVDDPYVVYDSVCTPFTDSATGAYTPGIYPTSNYNTIVYERRVADTTNQPKTSHDIKAKADWNLASNLMASANVHYLNADNDEVTGYEWNRDMFNLGVNLMLSPTPKIGLNAGYNYYYNKFEAMYFLPSWEAQTPTWIMRQTPIPST